MVHGDWRGWLSLTRSRRWSPLHISISARTTPCWGAQVSRRCRPMMPCCARSLPRRQTWTMRRSRTNFLPRSCCCSWSTSNHRPGSHGGGEGGEENEQKESEKAGADGRAPTRISCQQNRSALEWIVGCVSHGFDT